MDCISEMATCRTKWIENWDIVTVIIVVVVIVSSSSTVVVVTFDLLVFCER